MNSTRYAFMKKLKRYCHFSVEKHGFIIYLMVWCFVMVFLFGHLDIATTHFHLLLHRLFLDYDIIFYF